MSCMLPGIPKSCWGFNSNWLGIGGAHLAMVQKCHLKPLEKNVFVLYIYIYIHTCTNLSLDNRTQTHTFWSKFEKSNILHEPPKHAKPPKPSFSKFSDFKAMVKADPGLSSGKMPMFDDQIGCHIFLQSNSGSVHGACFLHVAEQVWYYS